MFLVIFLNLLLFSETLSRLCCKRSTSSTTNAYGGRPPLYCMRFATLKTTTAFVDKEAILKSNFCTTDCCSSSLVVNSTTATTNINSINSSITTAAPTTTTLSSTSSSKAPLASTSSANVTMYRYQMQQQQQQHQLHNNHQHSHGRCYCMLQPAMPQFNKTETKRYSKKSLKVTESVLRRCVLSIMNWSEQRCLLNKICCGKTWFIKRSKILCYYIVKENLLCDILWSCNKLLNCTV